jgi:hypothetical protein
MPPAKARKYARGPNAGKAIGRVKEAEKRAREKALGDANQFALSVKGVAKHREGKIFVDWKTEKNGKTTICRRLFWD